MVDVLCLARGVGAIRAELPALPAVGDVLDVKGRKFAVTRIGTPTDTLARRDGRMVEVTATKLYVRPAVAADLADSIFTAPPAAPADVNEIAAAVGPLLS